MTVRKSARTKTEQQFEAEIRAAVRLALPWIPTDGIVHQTTFKFKFGRADVTVNGRKNFEASARSDILIHVAGEPVAVLELKRPGAGIFGGDVEQGLSYARMMHPRPPLVIVTDGTATQVIETHSGTEWEPESRSESGLKLLFARAASAAADDLKRAVGHLMGGDPEVWGQAIRQVTAAKLEVLTKDWDSPVAPFVRGFLFRRKAVSAAIGHLATGARLILIQGPPLSGKTNALREMAEAMQASQEVFLYLNADLGLDLFDRLAGLLSEFLDWPVTADEAKHWLATVSKSGGPPLILAIDNVGADQDEIHRAVGELISGKYGTGVRIVLAVDDTVARKMMLKRDGRGPSELADKAVLLDLGPLDDEEFAAAELTLRDHRFGIMAGGQFSPEYREPWILRAMCAGRAQHPKYHEPKSVALLPPLPDLEIFDHVTPKFDRNAAPFARFQELAQAMLADVSDAERSEELMYEQASRFLIRRNSARKYLDQAELDVMEGSGLLRETKSLSGENAYVVRLPELLAYEIACLVTPKLEAAATGDIDAELAKIIIYMRRLPLGDLIAIQAIKSSAAYLPIMTSLLRTPPKQTRIKPGTTERIYVAGMGMVNITFREDGSVLYKGKGLNELVLAENIAPGSHLVYTDLLPWLILSHFGGYPFELVNDKGDKFRLDVGILLEVGRCPMPLRRDTGNLDIPLHELPDDISVICHVAGVTEPITWSIFRFLEREETATAERFIAAVIESESMPLLARTHAALHNFRHLNQEKAAWAMGVLKGIIHPAVPKSLAWAFMHPWRLDPIPPIVPSPRGS